LLIVFPLLNIWRQFLALNLLSALILTLLLPKSGGRLFTGKVICILTLIFFAHIPTFIVSLIFLLVPIEALLDLLLLRSFKPVFRRSHLYVVLASLLFAGLVIPAISFSSYILKYSSYIIPTIQNSPSFLNLAFILVLYSFAFPLIAKPVHFAGVLPNSLFMAKLYLKRAFAWSLFLAVLQLLLPFLYPFLFRIRFIPYNLFIVSAAYIYRGKAFNPPSLSLGLVSLFASSFLVISAILGSPHLYLPYCGSFQRCPVSDRTELIYKSFN
jgi:hypothetical protein